MGEELFAKEKRDIEKKDEEEETERKKDSLVGS